VLSSYTPNAVHVIFSYEATAVTYIGNYTYKVAHKVSHYQIIKKSYYVALKPANKIRFIR